MNPFEGFQNVDAVAGQQPIVYLDAVAQVAANDKRRMYDAQRLGDGMRVLDIGCGVGDDVRAIAELVGSTGTVVGLEASLSLLDEACRRGTPDNVEFIAGTGEDLPFDDATFDAVRAERVLQHVVDPSAVVNEMYRVVRDGGTVLTFDQDWKTVMVSGADPVVTESILSSAVSHIRQPRAGSRAQTLLRAAGFSSVEIVAVVGRAELPVAFKMFLESAIDAAIIDGSVDTDTAKRWLLDLMHADRNGEFFFGVTAITALGRKEKGPA